MSTAVFQHVTVQIGRGATCRVNILLVVINTCAPHGWNSLPESYRNFPQFCVDPEIASVRTSTAAEVSVSSPVSTAATLDAVHSTVVEEPTTEMCDISSVADVQCKVRQALLVLSNLTYSVDDIGFLQQSLSLLQAQVHEFISHAVPSRSDCRFRNARKLVKSSIIAGCLRRRLAAVRARHRAKKQSRMIRTSGVQDVVIFGSTSPVCCIFTFLILPAVPCVK